MRNNSPLLNIKDLHVGFRKGNEIASVLCGATLTINRGEAVGLVGESGCGKSVAALSILGLLGHSGIVTGGTIEFDGLSLHDASPKLMQDVRGKRIGMIFQDPARSLNPTISIGKQISEMLQLHSSLTYRQARSEAIALLARMGIADPVARYDSYPFQLSGGMCQRAAIAMALACGPDLLIADEPTTALDATVQAQILNLLQGLLKETEMALLLITHDLAVVASIADRVAVMNGGKIVENALVDKLFTAPEHPYTFALLGAKREAI